MANIEATYIPNVFGRTSFPLEHQTYPIFYKRFDGSSSNIVDTDNDTIKIINHFYNTGEPIKYQPSITGYSIGINSLSPGASGITTLPPIIYPIVVNKDTIRVALAASLALSNSYVDITNVGVGTDHTFEMFKQNSKSLITIDNIIQSPLSVGSTTGYTVSPSNNSVIIVDSLENIKPGTILKFNTELARVISILDYNTKSVILLRNASFLGTNLENINNFSVVSIMEGNYNILKSNIYFTSAPLEGKVINVKIPAEDIIYTEYSFNLVGSTFQTGDQAVIYSIRPPDGLISNKNYFLIKNFENNFSFASSYLDSQNNIKIPISNPFPISDPVKTIEIFQVEPNNNSTFNGRIFLKSNYDNNLVFDDISEQFNGITTSFTLTSSGINTVGIKSDNGIVLINNIFQYPEFEESFIFNEDTVSGITSITFIGNNKTGILTSKDYDVNIAGYPRGGIIVGYGLSSGNNYQPLVQAEAYVYAITPEGTIAGVTITNPGSGYKDGTYSVRFENQNEELSSALAEAIVSDGQVVVINLIDNVPTGTYTPSTSPSVIIDPPIAYDNVPLQGSTLGIGASVSFNISINGTIKDFYVTNAGYGYTIGEVLYPTGIVTASAYTASDALQFTVTEVGKDAFAAWNIGILQKLDDLTPYVDGVRKTFTIRETIDNVSNPLSLESEAGSEIDLSYNLLVFLNDVLQIPGQSYKFNGGTQITFVEAPPALLKEDGTYERSTLKVYFYKGTFGDTELVDVEETIKKGDNVQIKKDLFATSPQKQLSRTVKEILTSDQLKTELYNLEGLSSNSSQLRAIDWTQQKRDLIIDGYIVPKSRISQKSKVGIYTGISVTAGTFTGISTVGINTLVGVGIQLGDYLESDFIGYGSTVVSIGSSYVGLSTYQNSVGISSVSIWRYIYDASNNVWN